MLTPKGSRKNLRQFLLANKRDCVGVYLACNEIHKQYNLGSEMESYLRHVLGKRFDAAVLEANQYWSIEEINEVLAGIHARLWQMFDAKSIADYRRHSSKEK